MAASLGLVVGSLATETSGSILLPAEKGNVVGIKPTVGLTSRDMVIPISSRQDTVGPHARSVKDAAYLLSGIAGHDQRDNLTLIQPFSSLPDYAQACDLKALNGARLGIPRNGIAPFLDSAGHRVMVDFEDAIDLMRKAGATVIDNANFTRFDLSAVGGNSTTVLDTDFAEDLENYLSNIDSNPNAVYNLSDIMQFTRTHPEEAWPDRDVCFLLWFIFKENSLTTYPLNRFKYGNVCSTKTLVQVRRSQEPLTMRTEGWPKMRVSSVYWTTTFWMLS